MEEIHEIIKIINDKKLSLNYTEYNEYNPMRLFYERTSEKEICHSIIIADLLSPNGKHRTGDSFVKNFFDLLGINLPQEFDVAVTKERSVKRLLTQGVGERKVDIFIEWNDEDKKKGVIIENKLNNAIFQEMQVEDYRESLKREGYEIVKTVILSDNMELCQKEGCTYLYYKNIANWIESTLNDNLQNKERLKTLFSYINILKQKAYKSDMAMDAEKLLGLENNELAKIKNLVDCYNNSFIGAVIKNAMEKIGSSVYCNENSKECKLEYGAPKGNVLQIWNEEAYNINKLWVEIWFYNRQPEEELYDENAEIWIVSDNNKTIDLKKIDDVFFSNFKQDNDDNRYYRCHNKDKFSYNYLVKESRENMYKEIRKTLELISSHLFSL